MTSAQYHADDQLLDLYLNTLVHQESESADAAPIHQLFFHRIAHGRLERFYGPLPGKQGKDTFVELPLLGTVAMSEVRSKKWIINGQEYADTIDDLISVAMECLLPAQSGPGIIGHGDAHNGNVFLRLSEKEPSLLYFDPAFAGQHHPLLDLTKPLFHNVFAMWMYFPEEKAKQITIELTSPDEKQWSVNYNYVLHPVRKMFLESKVNRVLVPILQHLKQTKQLRPDWRRYLKAALFCCPFLTMNLTDTSKFPPEISLLGLSMSIEMGSESRGRHSVIDQLLDQVEMALKS